MKKIARIEGDVGSGLRPERITFEIRHETVADTVTIVPLSNYGGGFAHGRYEIPRKALMDALAAQE